MGCFPCFGQEKDDDFVGRNDVKEKKEVHQPSGGPPRVSPISFGKNEWPVSESASGQPNETPPGKDGLDVKINAITFTFSELAAATKNFRPDYLLGEGGFGRVYKGCLDNTGQVVAVKQLDRTGLQGNKEFLVEVLVLHLLHHPNLVNLIGYCAEGDQRLLVYEYMPLGSLEDHLHDLPPNRKPLDWSTRMKIALGVAKGLEYLHHKADPPVIYRDLKSANILLEEGFSPKLSDFGLAKLGPMGDNTHVSTRVMGTYGYCAPEYAMTGQLTLKSDVYSFGVVLLEMITGRRAMDSTKPKDEQNIVSWVRPMFHDRQKLPQMADPHLKGRFPMRGFSWALEVAQTCLHEQSSMRPQMMEVVMTLDILAGQAYDPNASQNGRAGRGKHDGKWIGAAEDGDGRIPKNEENGVSGGISGFNESERDDSPGMPGNHQHKDLDRERAVAEAKMWGENWRDRRKVNIPQRPTNLLERRDDNPRNI